MICNICGKIGFRRNFKYLNYIIVTNIIQKGFNPFEFGCFNPGKLSKEDAYEDIKKIVETSKVDWNVCRECVERISPFLNESEKDYINKKTKTKKFNTHEIKKLFASSIIFLILIFVCGGVTLLFFQARGFIWAKLSIDWPFVQGTVVSSSVKRHYSSVKRHYSTQTSFEAKVAYKYIVDDIPFEGDRIFFGKAGSIDRSTEEKIVRLYPAGKSIHVYYKPGNPKVCVLEPGKAGKSKLLIIFGILFFTCRSLFDSDKKYVD